MKEKLIGTYSIFDGHVDVFFRNGIGAEFFSTPDYEKRARMKIVLGADCEQWYTMSGYLIHEALEMILCQTGCRYEKHWNASGDNNANHFFMDHYNFSEASARLGIFISESYEDIKKAWKQWKREKK